MAQSFLTCVLIFAVCQRLFSIDVLKPRGSYFVCLQAGVVCKCVGYVLMIERKVREYDQELTQSLTEDQPMAP